MALILLRHTTPAIAPDICYGRTDLDLADTFETEAREVFTRLPAIERIVTSPLNRCRKLANFIAGELQLRVVLDPRLQEMDFGTWEGQPWSTLPRAEIDAWAGDFYSARPHGGESVEILQSRVSEALTEWRSREGSTLIVTHAGVIRAAHATGKTAQECNFEIGFGQHVTLPRPEGVSDDRR